MLYSAPFIYARYPISYGENSKKIQMTEMLINSKIINMISSGLKGCVGIIIAVILMIVIIR